MGFMQAVSLSTASWALVMLSQQPPVHLNDEQLNEAAQYFKLY